MCRLLSDVHAGGYLATIVRVCRQPAWLGFWEHSRAEAFALSDFGLKSTIKDNDLWEFCQDRQLLLVTGNRKDEGPDSLETAIRTRGTPSSLPVITLANFRWLRRDRNYRERAAVRLLEILLDVDHVRGTGRVYIPDGVSES